MNATHRAFSLMELLVVIAILALLAGVTLRVGSAVHTKGLRTQTESTIGLLELAMKEWETTTDRQLTWLGTHDTGVNPDNYDVHWDTSDVLIITEMLAEIDRVNAVRDIIVNIDEDALYTYSTGIYPEWILDYSEEFLIDTELAGELTVLDAWGTPIYATHPGRPWNDGDALAYGSPDDDGTIRTDNENRYGVARHRQICFISAGPDRNFGISSAAPGTPEYEATLDNIYSYRPE